MPPKNDNYLNTNYNRTLHIMLLVAQQLKHFVAMSGGHMGMQVVFPLRSVLALGTPELRYLIAFVSNVTIQRAAVPVDFPAGDADVPWNMCNN